MRIVQAPNNYEYGNGDIVCFLGGGIQKCGWHETVLDELCRLNPTHLVVINPKRDSFDLTNTEIAIEQIKWEFHYLNSLVNRPYIFSMYFDNSDSPQPICFYEIGRYIQIMKSFNSLSDCVISVHPKFSRKLDVITQVSLATDNMLIPTECTALEHANRIYLKYREIKVYLS